MDNREITASRSAATKIAEKIKKRERLRNGNRKTILYHSQSGALYSTALSEQDLSRDKRADWQSKLSSFTRLWTPLWLSVSRPVSKGIPQVTNKNLMKKSRSNRQGAIALGHLTLQACGKENVRLRWNEDEKTKTLPDCQRPAQSGAGSTWGL